MSNLIEQAVIGLFVGSLLGFAFLKSGYFLQNSSTAPLVVETTDAPETENQSQTLFFDHNAYQEALEAAIRTGRPLVIKAGAEWCQPCQDLKQTFADSTIRELIAEKAVFLEVEADRQVESAETRGIAAQILRDLQVTSYPTTLVVTVTEIGNGRYTLTSSSDLMVGMSTVAQLKSFLDAAL